MVPKNFRLSDEFAPVLADMLAELKPANPNASEGKLLEMLIKQLMNSDESQAANNEISALSYSLEGASTELAACKQSLHEAKALQADLQAQVISLQAEVQAAQAEVQTQAISLQAEVQAGALSDAFTALSAAFGSEITEINDAITLIHSMKAQIQDSRPIDPDEIILNMPDYAVKLLNETARRLSERFGREITPEMILSDIFIRYTVEQFSEWFYPFVIAPAEMEQVCGISYHNLKKALRQ